MKHKYFEFCDSIVRDFFNNTLSEQISHSLRWEKPRKARFNLGFMPEPYLPLVCSDQHPNSNYSDWLHVLLANPGIGLRIQTKDYVSSGKIKGVSDKISYSQFAHRLFRYYEEYFPRRKRLRAIHHFRNARTLAKMSGYAGGLQIDTIPWHSGTLRNKDRLPPLILEDELTNKYCNFLGDYLKKRSVICVDGAAGESHRSISKDDISKRPWIQFKAKLIGLDLEKETRFHCIIKSNGKITAAAISQNIDGIAKVMYCVRGGNHLPADDGLAKLRKILGR